MNLPEAKHSNLILPFLIAVSIFGIVVSLMFVNIPRSIENEFPYQRLAVGTAFTALCIFGILAALCPNFCLGIPQAARMQFGKEKMVGNKGPESRRIALRAHHPSCRNYSTHVLNVGKSKYCATCSGLVVGAIIAIVGTVAYFLAGFMLGNPTMWAWIGSSGVSIGLLQSGFPKHSTGKTRFLAGTTFVSGTFVFLISIDSATKSLALELFFVALCLLWILTKIALSQRDHYVICSRCSLERCS